MHRSSQSVPSRRSDLIHLECGSNADNEHEPCSLRIDLFSARVDHGTAAWPGGCRCCCCCCCCCFSQIAHHHRLMDRRHVLVCLVRFIFVYFKQLRCVTIHDNIQLHGRLHASVNEAAGVQCVNVYNCTQSASLPNSEKRAVRQIQYRTVYWSLPADSPSRRSRTPSPWTTFHRPGAYRLLPAAHAP